MKKTKTVIIIIFILSLAAFTIYILLQKPLKDANWELGQESISYIDINDDIVKITNLRDFKWDIDPNKTEKTYTEKTFNLSDIEGIDIVVSYFSSFKPVAHTLLNFRLKDGDDFAISVETRREVGEEFSILWGALAKYEIIYVVGSYNDLVGVRIGIRDEEVHVYPATLSSKESQDLLVSISKEINHLYSNPEFYNTFTNNCTNTIMSYIEDIKGVKIPFYYKSIAPGNIDKSLYKKDIIQKEETLKHTQEKYLIK